jgi:hypothetical protein
MPNPEDSILREAEQSAGSNDPEVASLRLLLQSTGTPGSTTGASTTLVFRPGGAGGGNVFTTAAQVATALAAVNGAGLVLLDDQIAPCTMPPSVVWDFQGRGSIQGSSETYASLVTSDTAQIRNLGYPGVVGCEIVCDARTLPTFQFDNWANSPTIALQNSGSIRLGTSTFAPIQVPSGATLFLLTLETCRFFPLSGSVPFVELGAGATLAAIFFQTDVPAFQIPQNLVGGGASATFAYTADAMGFPLPTQTLFSGTVTQQRLENAIGVNYTDTAPLLGATNVQAAIDALKARAQPIVTQQTLHVDLSGSDVTGTGSLAQPFLTIQAAINAITDASSTKRYSIFVNTGEYPDNIVLKPWIWIIGADPLDTRVEAASITLDPSWNPSPDNDTRGGFSNIFLRQGPYTFDFNAVQSNQGKLYFWHVRFNNAPTCVAFSAINQVEYQDCYFFAGLAQVGMNATVFNPMINSGDITLTAITDGRNLPTQLLLSGGSSQGTLTATWAANAGPNVNNISILALGFGLNGPLNLSGLQAVYQATADAIPSVVNLTNSAPTPTLLTPASGVAYTDSAPLLGAANVQQAINALKAFHVVGTTTPPNLQRATAEPSPVDATKQGIFNAGSDTSGSTSGATGNFSTNLGGDENSPAGDYSTTGGRACTTGGSGDVALGISSSADSSGSGGAGALAIGDRVTAIGNGAVAFGSVALAQGDGAVALGTAANAIGTGALAIGDDTDANVAQAIALGDSATCNDAGAALGQGTQVSTGGFHGAALAEGVCGGAQSLASCQGRTNAGQSSAIGSGSVTMANEVGCHALASGSGGLAGAQTKRWVFRGTTPGAAVGESVILGAGPAANVPLTLLANTAYLLNFDLSAIDSSGLNVLGYKASFLAYLLGGVATLTPMPASFSGKATVGTASVWTIATTVTGATVSLLFSTGTATASVAVGCTLTYTETLHA